MKKIAEEANAYYDKKPEKMNTYEASEGVKGLTPKVTQESHKKCTPGEFNMNKEGAQQAEPPKPLKVQKPKRKKMTPEEFGKHMRSSL